MKKDIYFKSLISIFLMLISNCSWAVWDPGTTCTYSTAYSVSSGPRDNRGIALSPDGKYLYLGYNNGPDFRRTLVSNGSTQGTNAADRAKNIAIDDMGRIYSTGPDGNPIKIYSSDLTTLLYSIPMAKCEGIAVKRESGMLFLYATEREAGTLSRFLLAENGIAITAHVLNGLDGDGIVAITGGSGIRGVAVGPDGKILVANPGSGIISRINSNGSGQLDKHYAANDNPYYFAFINGQVFVTHGNFNSGTRIAVLNYADMSLVGNIVPPFAALGYKTTDATDMISGIAASPCKNEFYVTYEDGSAADDSFKEPVIKIGFPSSSAIPLPTANVTGCGVVCAGSAVTLSGNPYGGTPPYTHSWGATTPGLISLINNYEGSATVRATGNGSATGSYTITDSYGCQATAVFNIGVNQQPGALTVSSGNTSGVISSAIACRWKGFNNSGANSALYLGYSSLGGGGARTDLTSLTYLHPGNNAISFAYDKAADKLIASINGVQLVYANVSIQVNALSSGKASVGRMNYLSLFMRNTASGNVSLNNMVINGYALSPFIATGNGSGSNWTIGGLDFGAGFTLTGTITLDAGGYGNNEASKVEFSLGEKIGFTCISPDAEICSGQTATIHIDGLNKNTTYTSTYQVEGGATATSSPFTTDAFGNGSFMTGTIVNSTLLPQTRAISISALNTGSAALAISCNSAKQLIVNPVKQAVISIMASANQVFANSAVTFTSVITNGGTSPVYKWMVNGAIAGTNSPTFTYFPANNDWVNCILISNENCTGGSPVSSNEEHITVITTLVWTGALSTDWNTPGNWNPQVVPTEVLHALVPDVANDPVVNMATGTPAVCNDLTINNGAIVTVAAGKALSVFGILTNNSGVNGLVIQSTVSGTGSLLHTTNNVSATVQRFISGSDNLQARQYHLVAVPVNNETYQSGLWTGSYLFTYTEKSNIWQAWDSPTGNSMRSKEGAMIYYPDNSTTYAITGQLNNGAYSPIVAYSGEGGGFNLVPNPYPSAIDWSADAGWTKTNIGGTIWGFDPVSKNYGTWNSVSGSTNHVTNIIPVGQAFFVQATASSPLLTMANPVRVHDAKAFLKSDNTISNSFHLIATGNSGRDEMAVVFTGNATPLSDDRYDAAKFYGSADVPQLSSFMADDPSLLSINELPFGESSTIVPLHFDMDFTGTVSFTATGIESFATGRSIKLEDRQLGKTSDLAANPVYVFNHKPTDDVARFRLHFMGVTGTGEHPSALNANVYLVGSQLYFTYKPEAKYKPSADVYNMIGQSVARYPLCGSGEDNFALHAGRGVYLVRLRLSTGTETYKIMVP